MALFRPTPKSTDNVGNKFTGVCEVGLLTVEDLSAKWDWADVYLNFTVKVKDSQYDRNLKICGSFDKDPQGRITGGSILNKVYRVFDALGCEAGLNIQGEWEQSDGTPIDDIARYLNDNHLYSGIPGGDPDMDYVAYIYKELNKKTGSSFNAVHYRLFPNTEDGKAQLTSHVQWMKTNGYLKEAPITPKGTQSISNAGASAL